MKFKPSKKGVSDILPTGGGLALGVTISKGAIGLAPKEVKQPLARVAIAAATILAASAVQGQDATAKFVRGSLLGVSIENASAAVSSGVAKVVDKADTSVKGKFLNGIAGMNGAEPTYELPQYMIEASDWDYSPAQAQGISADSFVGV